MESKSETTVREICKNACNQSGTSYEISFLSKEKDIFDITFSPKDKNAFVCFHILDIEKIEKIMHGKCKFISVLDGKLDLTFFL